MFAKDIMTKDVFTADENDTIESVIKLLIEKNISGIPVLKKNKLVGIVSEGDLIYKSKDLHFPLYFSFLDSYIFLENPKILKDQLEKISAYKVSEVMTTKVISATEDETIENLSTKMINKKINRIPIVNSKNELVGIVTRKDIIKSYSK